MRNRGIALIAFGLLPFVFNTGLAVGNAYRGSWVWVAIFLLLALANATIAYFCYKILKRQSQP